MKKPAKIYYFTLTDEMLREDKLNWFANTKFEEIPFERIEPDKNHNWLNIADNDFDDLLSLANKETKLAKSQKDEQAIFKLFSNGVVTARDEWVYDDLQENLERKVKYFIKTYNQLVKIRIDSDSDDNYLLKWTRTLKKDIKAGITYQFDNQLIVRSLYRPFGKIFLYFSKQLNEMQYQMANIFQPKKDNIMIWLTIHKQVSFVVQCSAYIIDNGIGSRISQCFPLYRYDSEGNRIENITNWGLTQFQTHYQDKAITKENIFHYTYAVLHHPAYREKYALNLKREFPRLPFYEDFLQWLNWGKQLMGLHLNYEQVKKYPLKQIELDTNKQNKPKLKADKEAGKIYLDTITTLQGIPSIAWEYKLGNRCALEWILDQYKEKKPRDKTIAEKFNSYRFADYKEQVIELLQRVCTVSVETMKIIEEMPE